MNEGLEAESLKRRRYREASGWLFRLHAPGASEEEVEEWLRWCEADGENVTAFENLQQDWNDTEGFKSAPELLPQAALSARDRQLPMVSWMRWSSRLPRFRWAVAASFVFAAVVAYEQWSHRPVHEVVATSNQEPATLPDGSSLLLSAKTTADVDFTGASRHVALRPGAEAYMRVRHDKSRPFIVSAGTITVTAVGTAFDVRREASRVIVTVEEGTILVTATGPNGPAQWSAGAGHQVDYSESLRTAVVSSVDTQSALRWRDGELAYDDAPLDAVIADINRYSTVSVVIRDPAIRRLRFTGTVFVASVNDWLKALEVKYPVHAKVSPEGEITLEVPASPAGTATH
jgi:transmembrane sensor